MSVLGVVYCLTNLVSFAPLKLVVLGSNSHSSVVLLSSSKTKMDVLKGKNMALKYYN